MPHTLQIYDLNIISHGFIQIVHTKNKNNKRCWIKRCFISVCIMILHLQQYTGNGNILDFCSMFISVPSSHSCLVFTFHFKIVLYFYVTFVLTLIAKGNTNKHKNAVCIFGLHFLSLSFFQD